MKRSLRQKLFGSQHSPCPDADMLVPERQLPSRSHYVGIVGDRSGSVENDLEDLVNAERNFVQQLDFRQAAVAYGVISDRYGILTDFTTSAQQIEQAIASVEPFGKTPFYEAQAGMQALFERVNPASQKTLVIATDGHPNTKPPRKCLQLGDQMKEAGIRIITISIGSSPDQQFLKQLASAEEHYHAQYTGNLGQVYTDIAQSLLIED